MHQLTAMVVVRPVLQDIGKTWMRNPTLAQRVEKLSLTANEDLQLSGGARETLDQTTAQVAARPDLQDARKTWI